MPNPIIKQTGVEDEDLVQLLYEMQRALIDNVAGVTKASFTVNVQNKSGTLAGPDE